MKFDLKSSPRHIQRLTNIASVISGINGIYVIIDNKVSTPYFNTQNNVCVLPNGDYSDDFEDLLKAIHEMNLRTFLFS